MLEVDIKKRFGAFSLDVSFVARDGMFALLGASGCGKSVTLKCVAGIEKPDSGKIVLNGRTLFDSEKKINLTPQKRRVGFLFQQYALFPNMTVRGNIEVAVRRENRARKSGAADELISTLRLTGLEDKRPAQLSGGQQQRVALARILVNEPELLMFDEPFSALDEYLRWQLELELTDTLKMFGGTSLFVSHNRDEVYRMCDNVCVLSDGKSGRVSAVRTLFESPETLSSCLLSGCKNFSRITHVDDTHVYAVDWGATLRVDRAVPGATHVGVRAHYVTPVQTAQSGENVIPCRVEREIEDVFSMIVMLKTPGGDTGFSRIRMELPKDAWAARRDGGELGILLRERDIMQLID
jgi:molybdate transport system ATP-binding protein